MFLIHPLILSGQAKLSMASCEYIIQYVEAFEHNSWTFEVHFDAFSVFQTVWGILYRILNLGRMKYIRLGAGRMTKH